MINFDSLIETSRNFGIFLAEFLLGLYFCKQYINKITEKVPIAKQVKDQSEEYMDIVKNMEYYKELLNADRILLFEFHNGQHYSNYRSALKMSASFEVYRAGLSPTINMCTNIPISVMPHFVAEITSKGYFKCENIEELKSSMPSTYNFKNNLNIKSFFDIAIKDKNEVVIGFVAVQWLSLVKLPNKEQVEKLAWYLEEAVNKLSETEEKANKNKLLFFKK